MSSHASSCQTNNREAVLLLLRVVITQNYLEMLRGRRMFWMMQTQHLHGW